MNSSTDCPTPIKYTDTTLSPLLANWYQLLSIKVWGKLPAAFQRKLSKIYAKIYDHSISKYFIKPYCHYHYQQADYLKQFKPPFGKKQYESFQDFFIREFKELPTVNSFAVWPCEGTLCHLGKIKEIAASNVKGDLKEPYTIFGTKKDVIPTEYFFSNVFLHNKNYHRIHAPIKGIITRIQRINGDLVLLRPWVYPRNPSIPAFRNERVNIDILDENGETWFLSIIGGPAVGTIKLPKSLKVGDKIKPLEEIALFFLGSTCCMASPKGPIYHRTNNLTELGTVFY